MPKNRQMQMFDNHGHKNIVTCPTGVTIKNGKTPQSTENQVIFSAFCFYPSPRPAQNIETTGVQKGVEANRCVAFFHSRCAVGWCQ